MFHDFQQTKERDARRRFGGSMMIAIVLYGGASVSLVVASATARRVVQEEKLTQVEFAPAPEPAPPKPAPEPVEPPPPVEQAARPKVKRKQLDAPDEVPLEKPPESDAPLAAADEPGPLDGFLDGVEGGRGTAPATPAPPPPPEPVKPEPIKPPSELRSNASPHFPRAALRDGVEGTVVVEFTVLPDGRTANPKILSGPKAFYEAVLEAVPSWRYEPATQGGKKVSFRITKKVSFHLEDA